MIEKRQFPLGDTVYSKPLWFFYIAIFLWVFDYLACSLRKVKWQQLKKSHNWLQNWLPQLRCIAVYVLKSVAPSKLENHKKWQKRKPFQFLQFSYWKKNMHVRYFWYITSLWPKRKVKDRLIVGCDKTSLGSCTNHVDSHDMGEGTLLLFLKISSE